MPQHRYQRRDLEEQNQWNAVFELLVQRLVMPDPDAEPCADAAADDGQAQQRGFADAAACPFGLPFVDAVGEEGDDIDGGEVDKSVHTAKFC